jgi:hypothetical protein
MKFSKLFLGFFAMLALATAQIEAGRYNYGSTSSRTGRATTNHVSGYTRSNGTYVGSYWRS